MQDINLTILTLARIKSNYNKPTKLIYFFQKNYYSLTKKCPIGTFGFIIYILLVCLNL